MTTSTSSPRFPPTPGARTVATPSQAMPPLLSPHRSPLPTTTSARTPSPNYFGFTSIDDSFDSDNNQHTRKNWSPPSSTVRSTAAFSPTVVPVDQNPDFDAFRRQSEGKVFSLGTLNTFKQNSPQKQSHGRTMSRQSDRETQKVSESRGIMGPPLHKSTSSSNNNQLDPESAFMGRSPKRHLSTDSSTFPDAPRRLSPPGGLGGGGDSAMNSVERGMPRLSMPPELKLPPVGGRSKARAETVPTSSDPDTSPLVTPQHVINLVESAADEILILDLRVSTQYARSRLTGALNLCIPTTLLKRPSFNVQKLAETFQNGSAERSRFEGWKSTKYLIVYDAASSQLKDATTCLNTLKKFQSEGYNGTLYAIKGGFAEFSNKFPKYIDSPGRTHGSGSPQRTDSDGPEVAPVVGGCPMPATKNAANPFFGNIRQNMDLIGGVGQMPLKRPSKMTEYAEDHLPEWLRSASAEKDQGARVSDKFLHIEKREQKRMQDALSGQVSYGGTPSTNKGVSVLDKIQIAGIEKGTKNRYNNIWPYEHTRVKLQDVPNHGCDYVNASHIASKRSNKKYIATQGPIPSTFTDFWNVVWQQDVRVIVMLTAEKEGGQVKAHNYWSDKQYGPMRLEFLSEKRASLDPAKIKRHRQRPSVGGRKSTDIAPLTSAASGESDQPFVIVRKLALSHEGYPFERMREVTQLQYSSWPDFGAPAHPAHLLGLVEQCDAVVRRTTSSGHDDPEPENAPPIVVHCSAGCGRTGTFCTVDTVLDMLKRQRKSRRAARERDGSPMQIDRRRSQIQSDQSDGGSFFNSGPPIQPADDTVDGTWVMRDDQDLIEKTVEDFRHQRLSMVQSLRQFVLCYETVMEWLVAQEQQD